MRKHEAVEKVQALVDEMISNHDKKQILSGKYLDTTSLLLGFGYIRIKYHTHEDDNEGTFLDKIDLDVEITVHLLNEDSKIEQKFEITELDIDTDL